MTDEVRAVAIVEARDRRGSAERRAADRRAAAAPSDAPQDAFPEEAAQPPARPAPTPPVDTSPAAFAAQILGQSGQRRGLKGGPPVLDAARSTYLGREYSGATERRPKPGRTEDTDV